MAVEAGEARRLHFYWISFEPTFGARVGFWFGSGVTAHSADDASDLLNSKQAFEDSLVLGVAEDITLAELDQPHILPNIGDHTRRGVWYPNCDETNPMDVPSAAKLS